MIKYTIERHLGRYVCVYFNDGSVKFGVLEKYAPDKDGYCHAREYTLKPKSGEIFRFRASDARKVSESRISGASKRGGCNE